MNGRQWNGAAEAAPVSEAHAEAARRPRAFSGLVETLRRAGGDCFQIKWHSSGERVEITRAPGSSFYMGDSYANSHGEIELNFTLLNVEQAAAIMAALRAATETRDGAPVPPIMPPAADLEGERAVCERCGIRGEFCAAGHCLVCNTDEVGYPHHINCRECRIACDVEEDDAERAASAALAA